MSDPASIRAALASAGLAWRGAFHPGPGDGVPGAPATLVLVGGIGDSFWPVFQAGRRDEVDPLDSWTRRILDPLAERLGAAVLYPFGGPPWLPFQLWAMRAEGLRPSPLGLLIHPEYGPWHSWRGALAFAERLDLPPSEPQPHPCDACTDRPCLSACPVGAFREGEYDVPACTGHLLAMQGVDCREWGCRARRACPVGKNFIYPPPMAAFLMRAFLWTHGSGRT